MQNYEKTSYTTYHIKYNLVWITKYCKPILSGMVAERSRSLIREICRAQDVEILSGARFAGSRTFTGVRSFKLIQLVKGKTARKLSEEFEPLRRSVWGRHLWARECFAASSGNVTDELIAEYIRLQDIEPDSDNY